MLLRLSIACDECLLYGDESIMNGDQWDGAASSVSIDLLACLLKLELLH